MSDDTKPEQQDQLNPADFSVPKKSGGGAANVLLFIVGIPVGGVGGLIGAAAGLSFMGQFVNINDIGVLIALGSLPFLLMIGLSIYTYRRNRTLAFFFLGCLIGLALLALLAGLCFNMISKID